MEFNIGSIVGSGNRLLYILIAAVALLVFLTVILVVRNFGGSGSQQVTLQVWGVFDERTAFDKAVKDFQQTNPNIRVVYTKFAFADYESSTINALAAGTGPDIWMIHNTWLPKHADKLAPLPDTIPGQSGPLMTIADYKSQFVDVAFNDLVKNGKIYSMPLYIDTLGLYYNKDLLQSAGFSRPPRTWNEFNSYVQTLTRQDDKGNITQAGAAIGSARNVNRSTDILMALMLQSGVHMTSDDNSSATVAHSVDNQKVGEIALQYYTDFTNPTKQTYCWNDSQHYSVDAFSEGNVAMMFNYSHQVAELRAKNARLNFAVASMPQLSETDVRTYASYWAPAVTMNSKNPVEAWKFINFLASKTGATDYLNATNRPSGRRDIIDLQKSDPDLGVFALQALSARSWYQINNTAIETIFANMIDDVNFGRATVKDALANAESQVTVLMSRR